MASESTEPTFVRSFLQLTAVEQSTMGTNDASVDINWKVVCNAKMAILLYMNMYLAPSKSTDE